MRNMSFALTTPQAYAQVKPVTRRLGWWNLQPGELVQQVVKGMGLKKGEKIERIHVIEIVSVTPERLNLMAENARVREIFTERQWLQLLDGIERARGRSVERNEHQTIAVVFINGNPRHLKVSDDTEMKP